MIDIEVTSDYRQEAREDYAWGIDDIITFDGNQSQFWDEIAEYFTHE